MKLENVTNSQTLNKFDLHALDSVVEINRDVDVGIHLPQDIIGKGAEFSEIRRIENRELTKLWEQMNRVLKNTFIHLSDETGIKAYENLINDEAIKGRIEERRKIIYALWNMVTIWTHRTLEDWLDKILGQKNYSINLIYNEYVFELNIEVTENIVNHDWLVSKLRQIIPANLLIRWRIIFRQTIYYGIYGQKAKKITAFPYKPQDRVENLNIYYGIQVSNKRIKRIAKMPAVWTINNLNMFTEVNGEGATLKYGD